MAQDPAKPNDPKQSNREKRRAEPLEDRILLSASWADAETGEAIDGPTDAADIGTGGSDADILAGLGGDDDLFGNGGDDQLDGGGGDDTLQGGTGDDTISGGAGQDTADYSDADSGVTVDLTKDGEAQDTGGAGTDTLSSIESVIGSDHNDTFSFSDPEDGATYTIDGGGGTNTLDLSSFEADDLSFEQGRIQVALEDGGSFTIEHTNVERLVLSDGPAAELNDGLVLHMSFDDLGDQLDDASSFDNSSSEVGDLDNGEGVSGSSAEFDGSDRIVLDTDRSINQAVVEERSVSLWFKADSTEGRQVLYEEGGTTRGVNAYIDDGKLYVGGWNKPNGESGWSGTFLSTENIEAGQWHNVTFTLSGGTSLEDDAFKGYLDGELFGSGQGSQLWSHGDPNGIGGLTKGTVFHTGNANNANVNFAGDLDEVRVYNREVNDVEIAMLAGSPSENQAPDSISVTPATVPENAAAGTLVATASATDPDAGDTVTFSLADDASGRFTIDPDSGEITVAANADLDHESAASHTITVRATDTEGESIDQSVTVTVGDVNEAVQGSSDSASTSEDTPVTINVLANDSDLDGDSISIDSITQPTNGTVTVNNDGTVTYTPDANYNGSDSFTYTVTDGNGSTATATVTVDVQPVNDGPTTTGDTATTSEDRPVTIDALANDTDLDGDSLSIDSVSDPSNGTVTVNNDGTLTYTPNANYHGTDTFTYTVSDGNGGSATETVTVSVTPVNDGPEATADTATTAEDTPLTINVLANDTDLDGDTLSVDSVTQPSHGSVSINNDGTVTYTPDANYSGTDSFTYTVSDGSGGTDTQTVTLNVTPVNDGPTAIADSATTAEDTPLTINILANDSDLDGDTLSIDSVTQPSHGSVTINDDGTVTYTPDANFNGSDTFTYTVADSNGGTDTQTVTLDVTPVNDGPEATADTATTAEDTPLTINVLANDTDLDGDTLSVDSVTQPSHGTVTINNDGTVTYTPDANYSGTDSFTYTVSDGSGGTDTQTVTLDVTPVTDAAIIDANDSSGDEDTAVPLDISVALADTDGSESLSITISGVPNGGTLSAGTDLGGGTWSVTPDQLDSLTVTMPDDYAGTFDLTVTATSSEPTGTQISFTDDAISSYAGGQDADGTYAITENGSGLSLSNNSWKDIPLDITIEPGTVVEFEFRADGEGEIHGIAFDTNDGLSSNRSFNIHGTQRWGIQGADNYTGNGDWQTIRIPVGEHYTGDFNRMVFIHDHDAGDNSLTSEFRNIRIIQPGDGDSTPETSTETITVTVNQVNDGPVATADSATTAEDQPVTLDLTANDSDLEGDTLTVTSVGSANHGTVSINDDGTVTYTPDADFYGDDSFTYTVSDGNGGTDTQTVSITVTPVNDAANTTSDSFGTSEDTPVTINVLANDTDAEGDTLTIHEVTQPSHGTVTTHDDGTITYAPATNFHGTDTFTYTVSDGNGGLSTETVTINVSPVNDGPTAIADAAVTNEDTPLTIDVLANDSDLDGDSLSIDSITQPSHGTATINNDGTVTYTPEENYNGADSFTYTVTDSNGGTDTQTVTIDVTPVNDGPEATTDTASTNEDTPLTIDILANDSDLDGDSLSIDSITQPSHGTATINNDGTVTYTPDTNYHGTDTFTYTITDGNGGTDTQTVTVLVSPINDGQVTGADTVRTDEDTPVIIDALSNDTDIDGDTLSIESISQPAHGAVTINNNGTLTYTPAQDFHGDDSFTYTVTDDNGATSTESVTVTVTPVNDGIISESDEFTTAEDTPVTIDPLANDADIDGDGLAIDTVTNGANGTVTINSDGTLTYTPAPDWYGEDTFTYTATDGNGATTTETVTVTVTPVDDPLQFVALRDPEQDSATPDSTARRANEDLLNAFNRTMSEISDAASEADRSAQEIAEQASLGVTSPTDFETPAGFRNAPFVLIDPPTDDAATQPLDIDPTELSPAIESVHLGTDEHAPRNASPEADRAETNEPGAIDSAASNDESRISTAAKVVGFIRGLADGTIFDKKK